MFACFASSGSSPTVAPTLAASQSSGGSSGYSYAFVFPPTAEGDLGQAANHAGYVIPLVVPFGIYVIGLGTSNREVTGAGAAVGEDEIIAGIQLLAETEGIFTEPAGGVTVAATKQLIDRGVIPRDESIVICITGNGYKTIEALTGRGVEPTRIGRSFAEFEAIQEAFAAAGS